MQKVLIAFETLSQETRLKAFRLLVGYGEGGAAAGLISDELDVPHNTLSFHLSHMSRAGLIVPRREGRSIIYTVNFAAFQDLLRFMIEDCCSSDVANIRDSKSRKCTLIELVNLPDACGE